MIEARGNSTPDGESVWVDRGPRKPGTFDMTEAQLREYDPGRKTKKRPRVLTPEQAAARATYIEDAKAYAHDLKPLAGIGETPPWISHDGEDWPGAAPLGRRP